MTTKREITKNHIKNAFLALLKEKNYDEITIQDILDDAKINRSTFYRHFLNKATLTQQIIQEYKKNFFEVVLLQRLSSEPFDFISFINQEIKPYRQELWALFCIRHPKINFKKELYQLLKNHYQIELQQTNKNPEQNPDFQAHLYASHVLSSISYFLEHPKEEPQELWLNCKYFMEKMLEDFDRLFL